MLNINAYIKAGTESVVFTNLFGVASTSVYSDNIATAPCFFIGIIYNPNQLIKLDEYCQSADAVAYTKSNGVCAFCNSAELQLCFTYVFSFWAQTRVASF